jgi:hypothetical protein
MDDVVERAGVRELLRHQQPADGPVRWRVEPQPGEHL